MRINRNEAVWSFVIAFAGLGGGIWFYFFCGNNQHYQFWSGLCIGLFTSSFLTLVTALNSYFSIKATYFFRINAHLQNINTNLQHLDVDCFDSYTTQIYYLQRQQEQFREMQEIVNDFKTFSRRGYIYRQVDSIHNLMLYKLSQFAYIWNRAQGCTQDDFDFLLLEAKELYIEYASDFQTLCKTYEQHSKYGLRGKSLKESYPLARDEH